jgi:hypothetical protein
MTKDQTRKFLSSKLNARVSDELLEHLAVVYESKGLVDVKRMLGDAMSLEEQGLLGRDQNLIAGCTVTVDQRPKSLRGLLFTPHEIEQMLAQKISERLRNDHPLSSLHKIFRGNNTGSNTRLMDRHDMRAVLCKFDIFSSDEEFEVFFSAHDRGDGFVEVRKFLTYLLPADDHELNPFTPKDEGQFRTQCNLAKVLSTMTQTRRRQVLRCRIVT